MGQVKSVLVVKKQLRWKCTEKEGTDVKTPVTVVASVLQDRAEAPDKVQAHLCLLKEVDQR